MFENIMNFFKKFNKKDEKIANNSKEAAKERLHLVLMQDRANVSADFLELMKQEIIEVIKKYIDVDEKEIDVRLTNKENADGTNGAPALYANIPILNIKNEARKIEIKNKEEKQNETTSKIEAEEQKDKKEVMKDENEELKVNEKDKIEKNEEKKDERKINQIENKEQEEIKEDKKIDLKEKNKKEEVKKEQKENKQEKTTKEKAKLKN